jgi:ammonia channel protein AmtB
VECAVARRRLSFGRSRPPDAAIRNAFHPAFAAATALVDLDALADATDASALQAFVAAAPLPPYPLCWYACARIKKRFGYDDALDVFGVHGIGGFVGTILVAVFGSKHFAGGFGDFEILAQLKIQSLASLYTIILSGVVSYAVLKVLALTIGLRITAEQENTGIDVSEHGEEAYNG